MKAKNSEITRKSISVMRSSESKHFKYAMKYAVLAGKAMIRNGTDREELTEAWREIDRASINIQLISLPS